jgi:phosphatidate cytidylyltransferase
VRSNLRTRVLTALVLAAAVVGTLATGSTLLWALLLAGFSVAGAWEFLRLATAASRRQKAVSLALLLALMSAFAYAVFFDGLTHAVAPALVMAFLCVAAVFWCVVVPLQLAKKSIPLGSWPAVVTLPVVIGSAWLAGVLLQRAGAQYLLAVVVITAVADIAGYFVGRAIGRVKLAPSISPGKTREGAIAGVLAAALWTGTMALSLDLVSGFLPLLVAVVAGAFLGVSAVIGDLWESLLKRQAGVKDSSQLLPGHGGVLDRIDAQLAVLPLATLLIAWMKPLW